MAAVALPLAILAVAGSITWRDTLRQTERELARSAEVAAEYAARLLDGKRLRLRHANDLLRGLSDAEIRAREAELHAALREVIGLDGAGLEPVIYVFDREGQPLVAAPSFPVRPNPALPARSFNQTLRGPDPPELHVSGVYVGRVSFTPVFSVAQRRLGTGNGLPEAPADAAYDGVLNIGVRADQVAESLRRMAQSPADVLALIHLEGEVLARSHGFGPNGPPLRVAPDSPVQQAISRGEQAALVAGSSTLDSVPRMAAVRRVEDWPVYVTVARPRAAVVARWRETMLPQAAIGLPATLALAALALFVRAGQRALLAANRRLEVRVAERTEELRAGEERLRLAMEGTGFGCWDNCRDTGEITWSDSMFRIFGYAPVPGGRVSTDAVWRERILPADLPQVEAAVARALEGGSGFQTAFRILRADTGEMRWVEAAGRPIRAAGAGRPARLVGIAYDVTDRKRAEDRERLTMREVDHRARNLLQVVQAALRLTRMDDPQVFVRTIEGRIAALARAQALLAAQDWEGADLGTLLEGELAGFAISRDPAGAGVGAGAGGDGPRVVLHGPALRLSAEAAQPLAMAVHELATNATKHGALSRPGGVVALDWSVDDAVGLLRMSWAESGGPPVPAPPARRGFGSRVLQATLGGQLSGDVAMIWRAEGLRCDVTLPLRRVLAEAMPPARTPPARAREEAPAETGTA